MQCNREDKTINKKSMSMGEAIVGLVFVAIILLVLIKIVPPLLGKSSAETSNLIDLSKDYDGDGVADYYDKCDCVPGDEKNEGCPTGMETKGAVVNEREEACRKIITGKK